MCVPAARRGRSRQCRLAKFAKGTKIKEIILSTLNVNIAVSPPDSLTQGSRLLLPHISTLLQYLSGVVRNTDRLKKKKFRAQVAKELNILSKLVSYLDENTHCSSHSGFFLFHTMYDLFCERLIIHLFDRVTFFLHQGQSICQRQGAKLGAHQPAAAIPPESTQSSSKTNKLLFVFCIDYLSEAQLAEP